MSRSESPMLASATSKAGPQPKPDNMSSPTMESIEETAKAYFEVRLDPNRKALDWRKRYTNIGGGWEAMRDLNTDAEGDEPCSDIENSDGLPSVKEDEVQDPEARPEKQTEKAWLEVKLREGVALEQILGPFDQLGKG